MGDSLLRMVETLASNPAAVAAGIGFALLALIAWGVVSSSYRYR